MNPMSMRLSLSGKMSRRGLPVRAANAVQSGSKDILTLPVSSVYRPGTSSFWLAFWYLPPASIPAGIHVLTEMGSSYANGWLLAQNGADLNCYVKSGGPVHISTAYFTGFYGTWMRVVMIADTAAAECRIYRNGAFVSKSTGVAAWNITEAAAAYLMAHPEFAVNNSGLGRFADWQIGVGAVPSASGVTADLEGIVMPGAVARYRLNEGSGTVATDSVGTNNGTLSFGGGGGWV
jgi:hypothetical protein